MRNRLSVLLLLGTFGSLIAATPPGHLNYQGVLRDSADNPLNGDHDMVFRFWSADVGGDEILVDEHTVAHGNAVTISGGMFNVELGGGIVTDGSGPGIYTTLAALFRDYGTVYLGIEVGGEILSPRVRILSSGYALNAGHLDGMDASSFLDTTAGPQTKSGPLTADAGAIATSTGITGLGTDGGGYFQDSDSSGHAYVGNGDHGIRAFGSLRGGYFGDIDSSGYAQVASGDVGIQAYGNAMGGHFEDRDGTSSASLAHGALGVEAYGLNAGGYFANSVDTGYAYLGYWDTGVDGRGNAMGGSFQDTNDSGLARLGSGNFGILAYGNEMGGYFQDLDHSGYAFVGYLNRGIEGYGDEMGGYFKDADHSGYAYLGYGNWGIEAHGSAGGGYFEAVGASGWAQVGYSNRGIEAFGDVLGGKFVDLDSGNYGNVGYDTYKIYGTGTPSFVQNHPEDGSRVIVYAAPEGDEVATYTRGTARLVAGEARIALGETFRWVTNPDIGLTAYLTPTGDWSDLYVAEKSTRELVVRSRAGAPDVAFDYIVYGLRIGFEEVSVVQEKREESFIPSMASHRKRYEDQPDLRGYNALERFKRMHAEATGTDADSLDLSASRALRDAIHEYDPAVDLPMRELLGLDRPEGEAELPSSDPDASPGGGAGTIEEAGQGRGDPSLPIEAASTIESVPGNTAELPITDNVFPVSEPVEPGDLLVLDPERPGWLRLADTAADAAVIGIVASEPFEHDDTLVAPLHDAQFAHVKVDASYGVVLAGDLLTTSPTPGHAMVATAPVPGTVLGKALEPLDTGTGVIRVLVMAR
jgi:hypothetical protein